MACQQSRSLQIPQASVWEIERTSGQVQAMHSARATRARRSRSAVLEAEGLRFWTRDHCLSPLC
jgi:hypothetical protein